MSMGLLKYSILMLLYKH